MIENDLLSVVSPEGVAHYLATSGWKRDEKFEEWYRFFVDGFIVEFPKSKEVKHYGETISNVIETVSGFEEMNSLEIFDKVVSASSDSIIVSFKGRNAEKGDLPLDYLLDSISNINEAIIYSACGEIQPLPFYQRKRREAMEIARKARFKQTKFGSFIMTISLPHTLANQSDEPIERRVIKRVLTGLDQAKNMASGIPIDYEKAYLVGLNANLAESISKLYSGGSGTVLEFGAILDRRLRSGFQDFSGRKIVLEETTFEVLKSIASDFRTKDAPLDNTSVQRGLIQRLSWDDVDEESQDVNDRSVRVKIITPENLPASAFYVSLSPGDYRIACDAHRDHKEISIKGNLTKGKKSWSLLNYSDFVVK